MPRRFVTHRDRLLFAGIGLWAILIGVLFEIDSSADRQVWAKPLWDWMFILGGIVAVAFALSARSWLLRGWSNALIVVGCAGRGGGLLIALGRLLGYVEGPIEGTSVPRVLAGIAVWSMLALSLYVVWHSRLPAGSGHRDGP